MCEEGFPTDAPVAFLQVAAQPAYNALSLPRGVLHVNMPLPRAGEIAEREEFEAALAAKSTEALRLFIERHPESRWRAEAETALRAITPNPER